MLRSGLQTAYYKQRLHLFVLRSSSPSREPDSSLCIVVSSYLHETTSFSRAVRPGLRFLCSADLRSEASFGLQVHRRRHPRHRHPESLLQPQRQHTFSPPCEKAIAMFWKQRFGMAMAGRRLVYCREAMFQTRLASRILL